MIVAIFLLDVLNNFPVIEFAEPMTQYAAVPIAAIIGLAIQLGTSIYAAVKSKRANDKAKAEADKLEQKQDAMYSQQQAEAEMLKNTEGNFMETAAGKGMVTEMKEQYDDAIKQSTANGLKRELTDEAKQAGVQTANKQLTDNMRNLAGMGTNYRLGILGMVNQLKGAAYQNKFAGDNTMANLRMGIADQENQSALNLRDNGAKVGNSIMSQDFGGIGKKNSTGGDTTTPPSTDDAAVTNNLMTSGKQAVSGMNNDQLSGNDISEIANNGYTQGMLLDDILKMYHNNYNSKNNYLGGNPNKHYGGRY
ncbi:MAG: hypothetical protein LBI45_07495 [Bacteroidales bacterium]|jgi:hypothetical protein|nr:hypothetical protein [Bacteroidales bacterium]